MVRRNSETVPQIVIFTFCGAVIASLILGRLPLIVWIAIALGFSLAWYIRQL